MKKQLLIFMCTIWFVVLFYGESIGLNLSIFALTLLVIQFFERRDLFKDKKAILLGLCVVGTSISHAWLYSFTTIIGMIFSSFVFRFYVVDPKLKLVSQFFAYCINWPAFVIEVFKDNNWLGYKTQDSNKWITKVFALVFFPLIILMLFIVLYISSSDWLSNWYASYTIAIDASIFPIFILGFYVCFVFWNAKIYNFIKVWNDRLSFRYEPEQLKDLKSTNPAIPLDIEYKSGVITFSILNVLLFFYIIILNVENAQKGIQNLSEYSQRTHDQVYLIIVSVLLAMLVILFYFKGVLNFIQNNKLLVRLAKIWIILNGVLIICATYQNSLYVLELGLTYKRLGVYLFLILCGFGLTFSFFKLLRKHKNFYLIDQMAWTLYYSLIVCSLFNWSSLITRINLSNENTDLDYLNHQIFGNEKLMEEYYLSKGVEVPIYIKNRIKYNEELSILSSELYYKFQ